jgi:branched-chain amino acid transport system ATP-binding protein
MAGGAPDAAVLMVHFEARGLSGGYPGMTVFSDASLVAESGQILAIVGANGSGKSALLETLQGLLPSRGGVILLDGKPVHDLPPQARAARGVTLLSDRRRLFLEMTIHEHLRVGAFRAAARPGWRRRALELYGLFPDLSARRRARPTSWSGGEQQQVALARFGMSVPRVWLLDDPLAGLDDVTSVRVVKWIRASADSGAAVILTGQHVRAFLSLANRAMLLEGSSLAELAAGEGALRDPRVLKLL